MAKAHNSAATETVVSEGILLEAHESPSKGGNVSEGSVDEGSLASGA